MSIPRPVERALVSLILGSALGAATSIVLAGLAIVAGERLPLGDALSHDLPAVHELQLIQYPPALPLTAGAQADQAPVPMAPAVRTLRRAGACQASPGRAPLMTRQEIVPQAPAPARLALAHGMTVEAQP
ncbi:MAG: hypothetical protein RL722_2514 [Pseudomonadota bacterium]|jgi:hypothetical protein